MTYEYKRHYGKYGQDEKTLCGLNVADGHMLTHGQENVGKITCKTCQRVLISLVNVGNDKMVEYDRDKLTPVNN